MARGKLWTWKRKILGTYVDLLIKCPLKNQNKKEGIIFHLSGTENQYIAVAGEFLFPELKDSNYTKATF